MKKIQDASLSLRQIIDFRLDFFRQEDMMFNMFFD